MAHSAGDLQDFKDLMQRLEGGSEEAARELVELWLKGLSNVEIAEELGIAETTVWRFWRTLLPDELTMTCLRASRSGRPRPLAGAAK